MTALVWIYAALAAETVAKAAAVLERVAGNIGQVAEARAELACVDREARR